MKAETWELLNGMGFGDAPHGAQMQNAECRMQNSGSDACASQRYDELLIPGFMFETTQSVLVPAAAYRAQGVGRVKRLAHQREKQIRDVVNGVFWSLVGFGVFALILYLGDKICG